MDSKTTQTNNPMKPNVVITNNTKKESDSKSEIKGNTLFVILGVLVLILAGVVTGYILSKTQNKRVTVTDTGTKIIKSEKAVGMMQENFKDSATGILKEGGIDGEGTHHLERDGGPSQYVYLTSSVVDLDGFVDKKVTVWGETNAAQKAGWLMDVGRLELQE